jgi:hypothetical protein
VKGEGHRGDVEKEENMEEVGFRSKGYTCISCTCVVGVLCRCSVEKAVRFTVGQSLIQCNVCFRYELLYYRIFYE